jgi:hypothetical protein
VVLIHGQEFTHLRRSLQSSRCEEVRFARDSPLEESGFEPLVPVATEMMIELARGISKQLGCWRSATWDRCRGCVASEVGPAVRIRFPPAAS